MIELTGDLFAQSDVDAICLTTNGSVKSNGWGVMGRGVAFQATRLYQGIAKDLGAHLQLNGNHVGVIRNGSPRIVAFPVKAVWDKPAFYPLIERSCHELIDLTTLREWTRVALPRPGCGNGGLRWMPLIGGDGVRELIQHLLDDRFIIVERSSQLPRP